MYVTRSQLIVQRDGSIVVTPGEDREKLAAIARRCCELRAVVAGNYVYRLSPVALWGSVARGVSAGDILRDLDQLSSTGVSEALAAQIAELASRYGAIEMHREGDSVRITSRDPHVLASLDLELNVEAGSAVVPARMAGGIKIAAARAGWPIVDRVEPASPPVNVRLSESVRLRPYQRDAVEAIRRAGNGIVLLPCGSGKTIVGVAALCQASTSTLILGPSRSVAEQWRDTLLATTTLSPSDVSLADVGNSITPVTIATYHAATLGQVAGLLLDYPWGMVIYDEVQSLPADVFRLAAALQSSRRLGLTATLVREDGRQNEVFALVGPPIYDVPWVELERDGWIAPAECIEVRIPEPAAKEHRLRYKLAVVERLLARHDNQPTLLVGSELKGLYAAGERFDMPVLSGKSSRRQRAELLDAFRSGRINRLALSRVGSVGIDLPSAEVLIQLSGTFGSRQEEAQRLGRLLRPQRDKIAHFYSLVVDGTPETRYAEKRQRFLVEQGYQYELVHASDLPRPARTR